MILEKFTLVLKGTIFVIHDITIENINVYDLIEKVDATTRRITLTNANISEDGLIDVFIKLGAPNGQPYRLELNWKNGGSGSSFNQDYTVTKNGILIILVSQSV